MEVTFDPLLAVQGETRSASAALRDYALMGLGGKGRSLRDLHQQYLARARAGERPPSTRMHTLEDWSSAFRWQERVKAFEQLHALADYEAFRAVQLELARRLRDSPEQFTTPELVALAGALIERMERRVWE